MKLNPELFIEAAKFVHKGVFCCCYAMDDAAKLLDMGPEQLREHHRFFHGMFEPEDLCSAYYFDYDCTVARPKKLAKQCRILALLLAAELANDENEAEFKKWRRTNTRRTPKGRFLT